MRILLLLHTAWVAVMLALALATLALSPRPLPNTATYTPPEHDMVDLEVPKGATSFQPTAISPNGRYIVGYADNPSGKVRAHIVLWNDGKFRNLSAKGDYVPTAVNDAGVAVGFEDYSDYDTYAVQWKNGKVIYLLPDKDDSTAVHIDRAGNVWGTLHADTVAYRAYVRKPDGTVTYLNDEPGQISLVHGVNEKNQAVLALWNRRDYSAMICDSHTGKVIRKLPAPPNTSACLPTAIGDNGDAVGWCRVNDGTVPNPGWTKPILWKNGKPESLPTPEINYGIALGINRSGDIIGTVTTKQGNEVPFLVQRGIIYHIGDLPHTAGRLSPCRILNDGTILIDSYSEGIHRGYLLKPHK